jgi:hypothetical protein
VMVPLDVLIQAHFEILLLKLRALAASETILGSSVFPVNSMWLVRG